MVTPGRVLAPEFLARAGTASLGELLAGATRREPMKTTDSKSGAVFERVEIGGDWFVVKHLHVDDDWIMRCSGDVCCRPFLVWRSGLLDVLPAVIDHAVVAAVGGLGRNGWGAALLMRDVSADLVPEGDEPVPLAQHLGFLDAMAALHARFWGWTDTVGLLPYASRWSFFSPAGLAVEAARGWPDAVPSIADRGWSAFATRVGGIAPAVASQVSALRYDLGPMVTALAETPRTFLHGDWKLGNLGTTTDGRTILLDWAQPGEGPACAELGWYLALNAARLPQPKEDAIDAYRVALERHGVATAGWFDRQLDVALLGTMVQFGWEKALGDDAELDWWVQRAATGLARLGS